MRKIRELLRLKFEQGVSVYEGTLRIGVEKTAASEYVTGFLYSGLTLIEAITLSDTELLRAMDMKKQMSNRPTLR